MASIHTKKLINFGNFSKGITIPKNRIEGDQVTFMLFTKEEVDAMIPKFLNNRYLPMLHRRIDTLVKEHVKDADLAKSVSEAIYHALAEYPASLPRKTKKELQDSFNI